MNCLMCNFSVLRRRRHILAREFFELHPNTAAYIIEVVAPYEVVFNNEEFLCHACWIRAQRNGNNRNRIVENEDDDHNNNADDHHVDILEIEEYSRAPNNAAHCAFWGCRNESRCRIPIGIKISLLIHHNYYVPQNSRMCQQHLRGNYWEQLLDVPHPIHDFDASQIKDMFDLFRAALQQQNSGFENIAEMNENELSYLTGFDKNQFQQILNQIPTINNKCNLASTALGIYLMTLRSGSSNDCLSAFLRMSRRKFERLLNIARECLTEEFVPRYLGFDHIRRDDVVQRNLLIPDALHGNLGIPQQQKKAIVICDGTYVYIQKSSNFSFQRKTYSLHKFDNLLKPFLIVCCDGYIIDVQGPHAAVTSDATIMKNMLHEGNDVLNWFLNPGDVFILDRGFRDAMEDLRLFGYEAVMPKTKDRNETQLTTDQANESRLVTMCRWVIEVVNGRFKRDFKLFRQKYFNLAMGHMFQDFRIAAALINAFHPAIENNMFAQDFLNIIDNRLHTPNRLAEYIITNNINRQRANFQRMTGDLPGFEDFPVLTENDLILFALGTYQLKLAPSYYAEHAKNGVYSIELHRDLNCNALAEYGIMGENVWLLRCRIQSRHANSRVYYSYVLVDLDHVGRDALTNYYCSCLSGKRTLGCCAHVMTIVWFLGFGRHQDHIRAPAGFLDNIIDE